MSETLNKKNKYNGKLSNLNSKSLDGLSIKPKNNLKYDMEVKEVLVVNQVYIEKILRKKITRKLDYFLKYIVALIDGSEDASNPENLRLALDDLAHYRSIIEFKYRKYLDEKYISLLLQKIDMLEHEIKVKLAYNKFYKEEEKEKNGKVR